MRKAWFYWQYREGEPSWNMQYAFRGHLVVLCDELTASDGEAVTEGVRRLELGTVMGTRTWGGEVWLSSSNFLVDRGIATAAEFGVFGPEGEWLIEGHGVEPDIEVDNPPHATFNGEDAQLRAAIDFLQRRIEEEPVEDIVVPPPNIAMPAGAASELKTSGRLRTSACNSVVAITFLSYNREYTSRPWGQPRDVSTARACSAAS